MGLVLHIVTSLGDALSAQIPVHVPDVLGMAIRTAVLEENLASLCFDGGSRSKNIRGPFALCVTGEKDGDEDNRAEDY